ncbi:MAG: rod shape-determining protein MreC [Victivallaceae bacterium]|nr:rod shape-determining protein MreC [Victivallaceae bacterium]
MPKSKSRIFEKWNSGLIISALLIVILAAGFQTLRQAWFRVTSNFFYPYVEVPAQGKYAAADGSSRLYSKNELAAKITGLETANRIFASKVARFGELTVENEKLRALLKLPKRSDCNYIAAEIIIRDPLFWKEGFTVNRGSDDGVIAGTPVLCFNPQYPGQVILTGVVKETARHSARVMSVLDPRFRISAYFESADTHGIINGDSRQTLVPDEINISFLSKQSKFTPGEKCFTSGFEHQIPGGFLIGSLKQLDSKDQVFSTQLYFSGKIIPATPLDSLNFVVLAVTKNYRLL